MARTRGKPAGALAELAEVPGLIATLTGTGALPAPAASEKAEGESEKYRATYEIGRELFEAIRKIAAAENVTPSDVVRFAVQALVDDYGTQGKLIEELRRRRYQPASRQRIR